MAQASKDLGRVVGKDAYEIAVELGYTGTREDWVDSLKAVIDEQVIQTLNNHIANKNNPHTVTKAQVGLGNVPNYPIATTAQAQSGTNSTTLMTPLRTKEAFNQHITGIQSTVNSQTTNIDNIIIQLGTANNNIGTLNTEVASLKTNVVNGKTIVANAINGKFGTQLSNENTFNELNSAIASGLILPEMEDIICVPLTSCTNTSQLQGSLVLVSQQKYKTNNVLTIPRSCVNKIWVTLTAHPWTKLITTDSAYINTTEDVYKIQLTDNTNYFKSVLVLTNGYFYGYADIKDTTFVTRLSV